ncbi:MAG: Quinolinate synthase A [Candidatus Heimdallarchaeota archaeon LC_3]|nr:MAG: Quinolinate synthase A [Candidatus Heimdallarchaeota archaeon LC_3]
MNSVIDTTEINEFVLTEAEIEKEAKNLHNKLSSVGYDYEVCLDLAKLTLEIKYFKEKHNAIIVAHSYQTPDIIFGIADYKGDSYELSLVCQDTPAKIILFCGVVFMAETAKILNPQKTVLIPSQKAGCSLADSITGEDVKNLKKENPNIPVVTYINTKADVKAESDIIVTSANVRNIIENLNTDELIFIPDKYMTKNMENLYPDKKFIGWDGKCIVHEEFTVEKVDFYRKQLGKDLHILVHTECAPEVVGRADMAGGTGDMIRYIKSHPEAKKFFLVTECGLSERLKIEFPDREFIMQCNMCPYMKEITLDNILECLRNPKPENIIELPSNIISKAKKSLQKMFDYSR